MRRLLSVIPLALACSFAGCGNGNAPVYPVTGKVTYGGKPMPLGGSIAFLPDEGQFGPAAGGTIDEEGKFVLSTYGDGDGAVAGKHRVVITQVTELEPSMDDIPQDGEKPAKAQRITSVPQSYRIPEEYADFRKSPLTATIEAKENTLTFDLEQE